MSLPLVIILSIVIFAVQMLLCMGTKKTIIRLIPLIALGVGEGICAVAFVAAGGSHNAAYMAVICAMVLAILMAVDALGWLTYCAIRFIRNVR